MTPFATPDPPDVEGLRSPTLADARRIASWAPEASRMELNHGHPGRFRRAWLHVCVAARTVTAPVHVIVWLFIGRLPGHRAYVSPDGDATITLFVRRNRWLLANHYCANPGHGQGRRLRALLKPALIDVTRRQHVTITATTRVPALRDAYMHDLGPNATCQRRSQYWIIELSPTGNPLPQA
ncbi:hypothetical protein GZ998_05580 [Actinomyces sp. 594]|uniref:hypothetical protein n=1 Tax=Actinomyces sp. 594 TaxID=2057793 RepID=UPI001C56A811|nr:hypothetical protein [Actinomyces sp. 594]MBW3068984.1 hypothetical protein [Actinomyces sp. 594]